jgi:general secretion pathway protein K
MAVIVGARYRTRVTSSDASVAAATVAAESAVNLAIAISLTGTTQLNVKFPLGCQMPGGEQVVINIEEETGKIDLNTATPDLLARFFMALTEDQSSGMRIATSIVAFRDSAQGQPKNGDAQSAPGATQPDNNKKSDSKRPGFTSIMQLDQVDGVSPHLFRTAQRFVTVRSTHGDLDKDAASPGLRRLLKLEQDQTTPARAPPTTGSVTIRADVHARDGARFIREALVSLGSEDGRPFRIFEWRHGEIDPGESGDGTRVRYSGEVSDNSCFRIGKAAGANS